MTKLLSTFLLAATLLGGNAAMAQTQTAAPAGRPDHAAMFQKMDLDGDGKLSKDEATKSERKRLVENFDAIDMNKDGFLDKDELKAFRDKMMQARKARQD